MKDFVPESIPTSEPVEEVFGSTEPKIIAKTQVRDIRKRCFLTGDGTSLSVYDTNDQRMKYGSGSIMITRSGYYLINYSFDLFVSGTEMLTRGNVLVNSVVVSYVRIQNYETATAGRTTLGGSKIVKLKTGDLISMQYSWGTPSYGTGHWLQVWEL